MRNLPALTGTKIDGLEVAKSVKTKVAEIVKDLKLKEITPCLATIVVGDNPASATYVRNKHKACEEVVILTKDHTLSNDITQDELNDLIEKLSSIATLDHVKHVVEETFEKNDAVSQGILYFNDERFWECQEVLEGVWKTIDGDEKKLVNGLILVAAGLVHYQKDEDDVCISIFRRALEKLENAKGKYHNIDIDRIKKLVIEMINSKEIFSFVI